MELKSRAASGQRPSFGEAPGGAHPAASVEPLPGPGEALPRPKPGSGGRRLSLLAVLAVILVGAAAFWLSREPATRADLRERAASFVDSLADGTPLAGLGDIFRPAPPPPPAAVLTPPTDPGTLAGRSVQGTVPAPVDTGPAGAAHDAEGAAGRNPAGAEEPQPGFVPPVTEDSRVRPGYVAELAAWLVSRYRPGPRGGTLAVSVQSLNQRCGVAQAGMAEGGRAGLLRYAFHPSMIQGLYALYVRRFLEDLDSAARRRGLDETQNRQFHLALAGRAVMLAGALEGVASVPDMSRRLAQVEQLAQNAVEINAQMASATFELDELRAADAPRQELAAGQLRVDGLSARYRRALDEQAGAQRALVAAIRKGGGQGMDDDSLFFVANWVERRLQGNPEAIASVRSAAGVLRDLARRCAEIGAGAPRSPAPAAAPQGAPSRP